MSKIIVRDDVTPQAVFDPSIGSYRTIHAGAVFDSDDEFVNAHPELFDARVEQATARPGEKRNTKRAS